MRFRTTFWLFLVVCLFGVLIWTMEDRIDSTNERVARNLRLLSVDPGRATMMELGTAGFHVVCAKRDDTWYIERPLMGRADASRIERILAALEAMRRTETITVAQRRSRDLSLEDYGLTTPATTVIVGDGFHREVLQIGAESPLGGELFVKLARSDDVLATQAAILKELPGTIEDLRDHSLFSGEAFRTTRLEIQRPETGFTQLARRGGAWVVQQPFQANANDTKIAEMLDKLYAAKILRFVWDKPVEPSGDESMRSAVDGNIVPRAEAYGLVPGDAAARIAVWLEGKDVGVELLLGKSAGETADKSVGGIYAKFGGADALFTVSDDLLKAFSVDPIDLRDKNLFTAKPEEVHIVSVKRGDGNLVLRRMEDSGWTIMEPVQWKADDAVVTEFVRRITRLRAEVFLKGGETNLSALGLSPPKLILRLDSQMAAVEPRPAVAPIVEGSPAGDAGGGCNGLCIGDLSEDAKSVYAKFEGGDVLFKISAVAVDELGGRLTDALMYRDRTMLSVAPDSVKRVTLAIGGHEKTIAKSRDGRGWIVEGDGTNQVDLALLSGLLSTMANLRAVRIDSRNPKNLSAYGLDPAGVTLILGLSGEEGIQKKIMMGFRAGTDGIYSMVQGQDVVIVLPEKIFTDMTRGLTRNISPVEPPVSESPKAQMKMDL